MPFSPTMSLNRMSCFLCCVYLVGGKSRKDGKLC